MELTSISKEISLLRSFAISIVGKDAEGTYNPAFVRRAMMAAHAKPTKRFVDAQSFLKEIEG
jgi:hypothetical protein